MTWSMVPHEQYAQDAAMDMDGAQAPSWAILCLAVFPYLAAAAAIWREKK